MIAAVVCYVVLQVGCGPTLVAVHGSVRLDGKPLNEAVIVFVPIEAGRKKTGAEIVDGTYLVETENGLVPGKYRVEVVDNPPLDSPSGRFPGHATNRRAFPGVYGMNSPLSIELQNGGSTEFDFELKSK